MTQLELVQGATSEAMLDLLHTSNDIKDIKRAIITLPRESARRIAKIQELISISLRTSIKAIWTEEDVRRVCKKYDLIECSWSEYIGYAPVEVERMVERFNEFITSNGIQVSQPWNNTGATLVLLCDKKQVVASPKVDPFLCIRVNDALGRSQSYFMMHKWGPDVTAERAEIISHGHGNFLTRFLRNLRMPISTSEVDLYMD